MSKKLSSHPVKEMTITPNLWIKWFPYFLGFFTIIVYFNSIQNGYNLDDELVTRNHPLTSKGINALWEIITSPYYSDEMGYSYGYRPIVLMTFAIENYFFGEDPHVGHFINLLIYVFIVVLGYNLLAKLLGENHQSIAFFAMLVFAVHPVHTEVVNSLKNRDELLALFFALISLSFLVKENFNEKKYLWFLLFCLFLVFSVLSKKSSVPIFFCAPLFIVNKFKSLHYLFFSLIISFLLAIFGSDFDTLLSIKLFLVGGALSISFFALENWSNWQKKIPEAFLVKNIFSLLFLFSFLLLFIVSIFYESSEVLIAAYVFLIVFVFLETTKKELISFLVVFSLFLSGLCFKNDVLSQIAAMLCIFILVDLVKKAKEVKLNFSYLVWFIPLLINHKGAISFDQFIGYSVQLFLLLIIYKYDWFKFVVLLVIGSMIAFYHETEIRELLFLLILFFDKVKFFEKIRVSYYHFVILGVITLFVFEKDKKHTIDLNSISKIEIVDSKSNNIISEGRELNFAENPLVNSNDKQQRLIVSFETVGQYIKLLVFPYPLKFYYGYNDINTDSKLTVFSIIGFLFFCTFIFLFFFFVKNRNYIIMFFIVSTLLSLSLFSNWFVLVAGIIGERLVFEASFSFIFIVILLIFKLNFASILIKKIGLSFIVVLFSLMTIHRNTQWKDPISLMGKDIKHLQNSAQANNLFALSIMKETFENDLLLEKEKKSLRKKAVYHFKKAVNIYPNFSNAWYDLGRSAILIDDTSTAINGFQKSIQLNPNFIESYIEVLTIYEMKNDKISYLKTAQQLFKVKNDSRAYFYLSKALFVNGKLKDAIKLLKKGVKLYPTNNELLFHLKEITKQDF